MFKYFFSRFSFMCIIKSISASTLKEFIAITKNEVKREKNAISEDDINPSELIHGNTIDIISGDDAVRLKKLNDEWILAKKLKSK